MQIEIIEKVARFVKSHPGFYEGHNENGVVIGVDWINVNTRETGREFHTVKTIREARDVLGY